MIAPETLPWRLMYPHKARLIPNSAIGGDTGYRAVPELPKEVDDYGPDHDYPHCPAFAEIGTLRGPFNLGLIPIGAYDPRYIMSSMHANPFDSVNIFKDTKCNRAMGIHWGTWGMYMSPCCAIFLHLSWALPSHVSASKGRVLPELCSNVKLFREPTKFH